MGNAVESHPSAEGVGQTRAPHLLGPEIPRAHLKKGTTDAGMRAGRSRAARRIKTIDLGKKHQVEWCERTNDESSIGDRDDKTVTGTTKSSPPDIVIETRRSTLKKECVGTVKKTTGLPALYR